MIRCGWSTSASKSKAASLPPRTYLLKLQLPCQPTDEVDWQIDFLPCQAEVESLLRKVPRGKAAGLDNIPGEVLSSGATSLAPLLHTLYLKSMLWAKQPTQFRGGILYECFKNSGSSKDTANFRSLFISSTVGKCYHRLVKNKVQRQTQQALHPLHCGPRQKAPVLFPELFILTHVRRCYKRGLSYAILYLDTRSAYYSIAREVAMGDIRRDSTVVEIFRRFNLGPEDMQELMAAVQAGGVMTEAGIPPALLQVIRDLHHETWFTTRFSDGTRVCKTLKGSRPGESLADTIFAFIYSKLLCSVYENAAAEDLAFVLPFDSTTGIYGDGTEGTDLTSWDATWADDSAFVTTATTPDSLLRKACRLSAIVIGACHSFGLTPNMKAGKTSIMLSLRGKGSTRVRREYFQGGAPALWIEELGLSVPVVPQYGHLGGFVDLNNTGVAEARHRIALAGQSYDAIGKLMLNRRDLDLQVRAGIFNTVVTASFFNVGLLIPNGKAWSLLENAYSRLVRRFLGPGIPGERIFHVPLPVAHLATGCWTFGLVARRASLSLLVSLAANGPDLLWAALQAEQSWLAVLRDDLRWFVGAEQSEWPLLEAAAWPEWRQYLIERPDCFKRRVVRRLKATHDEWREDAFVKVCHWGLLRSIRPAPPAGVKRWPCGCHFDTKAKLSVHFFKKHKRVAEYRQYVQGTCCAACGKQFWTGGRLAAHLRASSACVETLRTMQCVVQDIQPGFGSRKLRQSELENYTPAAPERFDDAATVPVATSQWHGTKKLFYEAVCDAALESGDGRAFETRLRAVLASFPVYPAEISEVLAVVADEIQVISECDSDPQWSRDTAESLQATCAAIAAESSEEHEAASEPARQDTFEDFQRHFAAVEWSEVVQSRMSMHGTQVNTLIVLPSLWEAEWRKSREVFISSAVLDQPIEMLPIALRRAWTLVLGGEPVAVRAPEAFWQHPVAGPFVPLREDASN